ncbi:MAG: LptE family protein [Bacteroidales bacterium]|nr:LptE family protein [Bacteroidales bacterium]
MRENIRKTVNIISIVALIAMVSSCTSFSYSFTGSQTDAKTISISYFPNKAPIVNPSLSQSFTEALRDKFINQSKLELVERNGELQLEGEITDYTVSPVAIQGNETAALNRLTIKVMVRYSNTLDDKQSFEQSFSANKDYAASVSLPSIETQLVSEISTMLVEDIFNKALVNW